MIVYRVVKNLDSIYNGFSVGENSFRYERGKNYLHFFILPENAEMFQHLKFGDEQSVVLKCDIPKYILENNFGVGMYLCFNRKPEIPFLEVRIDANNFDASYVKDINCKIKDEWKDKAIFEKYVKHCVMNDEAFAPVRLGYDKIKINPTFDFFEYFKDEALEIE